MPKRSRQRSSDPHSFKVVTRPRRAISEEIWNRHRQEIERLYVIGGSSLQDLDNHFRHGYGFSATKKQWKERLAAWDYRKNFNPAVAACVLLCYQQAKKEKLPSVCVKFNGRVKTYNDVRKYIQKSTTLQSEEDLLKHVPEVWPSGVTSEPAVNCDLQSYSAAQDPGVSPGGISQQFVSPPLAPLTLHTRNENLSPQSLDHDRFDAQRLANEPYFAAPAFESFFPFPPHTTMGGGEVPPEYGPWDPAQSLNVPGIQEYFHPFDFASTFQGPNTAMAVPDVQGDDIFAGMNMYGSVTPMGLEYNRTDTEDEEGRQTEIKISAMLGTKQDFREAPLRSFLVQCCAASVWYGQNDQRRSEVALHFATAAFAQIIMNHYTWFLAVLNNMRVLLDSYGHRDIIQRILRRQQESVPMQDHRKRFVIEGAIQFMLDTFEWQADNAQEHLSRARDICDTAKQTAGEGSPLEISASYNLAWVLLEANEDREALSILSSQQARCETVYGRHQIQTITWVATRARAHRKVNDQVTAEGLMEETVAIRVEKAFSRDHPLYWEIQFRRGLFLLTFARDGGSGGRAEECWDAAEGLLKTTLSWRRNHLGPNNPKTSTAWQWFKYCLEIRGKTDDATELDMWWQNQQ